METRSRPDRDKISITMKLHSTQTQQYQTITGYENDWVEINAQRFDHSFIVLPETPPQLWKVNAFDLLQPSDFDQLLEMTPDLVILGTGLQQRFASARLTANLMALRIGVECMDNQAACRTYNILMAEGRKVALAVILPTKV
jgi:uncharacterized protein